MDTHIGMWNYGQSGKKDLIEILDKINDKINIIYDIGSNVGSISLILYEYLKPNILYCFEPDLDNINYSKNKLKDLGNFLFIQKGIYYGKKEATVFGRNDNSPGGYYLNHCVESPDFGDFYNGSVKYDSKIFELTELEDLDIIKPDLIKLDVEGSEYNIIKNSTILKQTKYLLIEWHFPHISYKDFFKKYLPEHKIIFESSKFDNQILLSL